MTDTGSSVTLQVSDGDEVLEPCKVVAQQVLDCGPVAVATLVSHDVSASIGCGRGCSGHRAGAVIGTLATIARPTLAGRSLAPASGGARPISGRSTGVQKVLTIGRQVACWLSPWSGHLGYPQMGEGQLELADAEHQHPRLLGPLRPQPRAVLPFLDQGGAAVEGH